ncbi:hypothetical protein BH23GEM6_BH23GEM6_11850 [soil metagenome]
MPAILFPLCILGSPVSLRFIRMDSDAAYPTHDFAVALTARRSIGVRNHFWLQGAAGNLAALQTIAVA